MADPRVTSMESFRSSTTSNRSGLILSGSRPTMHRRISMRVRPNAEQDAYREETDLLTIGYDISDYESINPDYGTVEDAERLIRECHQRGLRIIFDLVINHTSDQHKWFQESRSSKDNPKRDWYSKPMDFPDAPVQDKNKFIQNASSLFCNGPRMHEYLTEMGEILDRYDAMTVGELPCTPETADVLRYVSLSSSELSMVFQFDIVDLDRSPSDLFVDVGFNLNTFKDITNKWQTFIDGNDGWTTVFLENHDQGRSISRYADDSPKNRVASAKMLATYLATLSGTPFIYQGQELGMSNVPSSWQANEYKDLNTINYLAEKREGGAGEKELAKMLATGINKLARDNARTPVQWTSGPNAGFTREAVQPWMRINDNFKQINAEDQLQKEDSVLAYYKRILALRKEHSGLFTHGRFLLCPTQEEGIFAFIKRDRSSESKLALVVLNFSDKVVEFAVPRKQSRSSSSWQSKRTRRPARTCSSPSERRSSCPLKISSRYPSTFSRLLLLIVAHLQICLKESQA
ncbi:hypothetical protein L7F22_007228 [Adiantum nelumboides]|nr:hypothetical protein [Adiantum nelumboides]